ncbi:MFS transporter [Pectobacterium punjabense]|uniref:MFS transporter n=2 Tax=Pectobacterium punjabense TaxID=2108399 RepID=A0ABX6L4A3_9GAMM|nr:MFS transporter [Pectobacterium punjabense]MBS4429414.1 MFS transporter [Pectobacterium punjabense]PTA63210.1 MFS transporter [Pectobacterium punjabense]QJA21101.1 MFS transporter [Pectobacterium punjabense]
MSPHQHAEHHANSCTLRVPGAAYVLTFCIGVIGSNSLLMGPIAPELAASFKSVTQSVMLASAAFGLGTALSALFLARYIDRFGAFRMLKNAMMLLVVALLSSAVASSVEWLIASQLIAGIASGVAIPAIYTTAAAIAPKGLESKTTGVVLTGWTLSLVAGVSLASILAEQFHWRIVYLGIGGLAVLAIVILSRLSNRDENVIQVSSSPLAALSVPGVKPLLAACGGFMTAFYGVYGYLGDYLYHGLHQPLSANGLIALCYGIGFGSAAFLDAMISKVNSRVAMPASFLTVAAVYLIFALSGNNLSTVCVLMLFLGTANHLCVNLLITGLNTTDASKRGAIMGLNSAVTYLAVFAGNTFFGALYQHWGYTTVLYTAVGFVVISILFTLQIKETTNL